ncbi:MAG: ABC transporter substrate-binding protein [Treponema sp.]|jgi:NitT/TauT family transport system substrate-binding protein|nr:ABC transporter substrate-binding protein [Treponema sp.]
MKYFFIKLLCFCAVSVSLAAQPSTQNGPLARVAQPIATDLFVIKGPSGVGLIRLFEDFAATPDFVFVPQALAQADLVAARFISGEAKAGILPPNVAAKIAASGKHIQVAAVVGTGMLSLLVGDPAIQRLEDLSGKTVEVAGQGSTPDYVFRKILLAKGMDPEQDVKLSYSLAAPEMAQSLIAGRVAVALLPEPFATMARAGKSDLRELCDIQTEWAALTGSANYPITVLVVDADFAAAQPQAITALLTACKSSIEWVVSHADEAGTLTEQFELGLRAPVVRAAIPRSNYVFIPAQEARNSLENLFKAFLEFAPASIGGALPADAFYYQVRQ